MRLDTAKVVFLTLALCSPLRGGAAHAAGNGQSSIVLALVQPLTMSQLADLEFGRLSVGPGGGTAVIDASGSLSVSGDVVAEGGTVSAASFEVDGHHLLDYDITLPATVVLSSGANTMTVDGFTTDKPGNVGDIPPGNTDTFYVGATLHVAGAQPVGTYTGTFDVTVSYQ